MTKDIEKVENETLPAQNLQHNPYERHGAQTTQRNIVGQLLKFIKGRWLTGGANNEMVEIEAGTRAIVNMASLTVGWQKWEDDKPVDNHMGLVSENYQPPNRTTLGDNKEDGGWERDENGVERDPWQKSNMVIMREIGTEGDDEGLYTFATSSRGGINAIGVLSTAYGKKIRENNELLPIVELRASSYAHSNKQRGIIDIPVFTIVGWGTAADVDDATETVDAETGEVVEAIGAAPKKAERAEHAKAEHAKASKKPEPAKKTAAPAGKKKTGTRF
jgi:hypothetical protein